LPWCTSRSAPVMMPAMIRAANPTANSNADILSIAWKQPAAAVRWRPESLEVQGLDSVAASKVLWALCVVPHRSLCTNQSCSKGLCESWNMLHLHTVLMDGHSWRRRLLLPKIRTADVPSISPMVLSVTIWRQP